MLDKTTTCQTWLIILDTVYLNMVCSKIMVAGPLINSKTNYQILPENVFKVPNH